jgi:AcrR family transcriptional regulator
LSSGIAADEPEKRSPVSTTIAGVASSAERPLRADAERNRRRLLDAADELLAEKGLSVGLDEIARHAGVGVATAYRRFPDKALLVDTLLEERVERIAALAEEALEADDPWEGLVQYLEAAVELHSTHRGVKELMFGAGHRQSRVARVGQRMAPLTEQLVRRAQASGQLRADVELTDIALIQRMVSALGELRGPHAPGLWRRYLRIVIDGLRTPEPGPLGPPPLTTHELVETVAASRG